MDRRTIPRNHTRKIAELRQRLNEALICEGYHGRWMEPVPIHDAWEMFDHGHERGLQPRLRELGDGTYEIRGNSTIWYVLRHSAAPGLHRVDIVVDRSPDEDTSVEVYINGTKATQDDNVHLHVLDPGRNGADHQWFTHHTRPKAHVPHSVLDDITSTARQYHRPEHCAQPECGSQ